jgi:hypothetical protein
VITSVLTQINPSNLRAQYASGDNDARHLISGSYIYQLPFKSENRLMNAAIGGWMISGTMFYRTGFPFSIIDGGETAALVGNNLGGTQSGGATILAQPLPSFTQRNFSNAHACVLGPCFSSSDFATSTDFMGSVGRNAFRGPGFLGGDMSVRKNFAINERMTFQLGLNAYNWFNHANYGTPYPNTNAPFFGSTVVMQFTPTSPYGAFAAAATDQRIAQITGKFIF